MGKDSLFVAVQQDTIYLWDMAACAYCSATFDLHVTRSADTIYVVQTDTAGQLATCGCVFNLRASITGLPRGTYWIAVYRDLLKKYGYSDDVHQFIGALQCQYEPATSPALSWNSYQSGCSPSSVPLQERRAVPGEFALLQIYPNPFNPSATVQFRTTRTEYVVIKIFDILGREVQTLLAENATPGLHALTFAMAKDSNSGIYFCRMVAGSFSQTRAMVLLR